MIGESGLTNPLHEIGYVITGIDPDYVVLGETHNYNYEVINKAIQLIEGGSQFITTNPDACGPTERGLEPACGALAA